MMLYRPPKKLKKPATVSIICIALALVLMVLSAMNIGWKLGEQILVLVLVVVFIDMLTRYYFTEYTYKLGGSEDDREFAVIKKGGNREMAVCNFNFSSVICVQRRGKLRSFEKDHGRMDARYNYTANMLSDEAVWIYFTFNGKKVLLTVEANDEFFRMLENAVISAHNTHLDEQECTEDEQDKG